VDKKAFSFAVFAKSDCVVPYVVSGSKLSVVVPLYANNIPQITDFI